MKANFRQVYVYNLDVVAIRKDATLPTMGELIDILERRRLAGQTRVPIQSGDINLTLAPIIIDPTAETAVLLVRHSDKHAAESVSSDILNDTFTSHARGTAEGGETGVHVFLSLAPERATPNRYTCIVEKVPTIDVATIRRFLNRVIHDEYDQDKSSFEYPHPGGQRNRAGTIANVRCLPRFEFGGRPSQRLAADVQQGRLTGIVLKRAVTGTSVGGVPFLKKQEATLKLDIDHGKLTANIWGDVKRALASEAANFPTAQIGFRLPTRTKSVSVEVDTANGAPLTELYVQSFDVTAISPPMAQSARAVVPQLNARVLPLLTAERNI